MTTAIRRPASASSVDLVVDQVPVQPLIITVPGVDLSTYDSATLVVDDPGGDPVDTSGGVTTIVLPGQVKYSWGSTTLFPTPGEYSVRVRLVKGAAIDYTDAGSIYVYREV